MFVDHVADAHCRDDLHEVGGQAPVESQGALRPQDVSEQAAHGHLRASCHGSCGEEGNRDHTSGAREAWFKQCGCVGAGSLGALYGAAFMFFL